MKKLVRVLSVVMLIAMMMSIMNITAFAEVFDENGNAVSGNNNDGVLVVSADPNADLKKSEAAQQVSSDVLTDEEAEEVPVEAGSTYSILSTSANALDYFSSEAMLEENPIIYYNAKYIVYIREHMDELKATNPEVVDTAYALFGEKYMDMTFGTTTKVVSKSVALKSQIDSLSAVIEKLEALSADPSDADGILAMRKAAVAYRDTFQGVANYDFTDETSGFTSLDAALEAAKAELANVKAELDNLGNEEKKVEKKEEVKESEETEEVIETPVPTTTPTPNEAIVEGNVVDAAGEGAGLFNPLRFFKLFATPLYTLSDLVGKNVTLDSTVNITGLPDWPIIITLNNAVITAPAGRYAFAINDVDTIVTIEACTIIGNAVDVCSGSCTLKYVNVNDTYSDNIPAVRARNTGSRLEIGNCEINSTGDTAVDASGSNVNVYINGYNKIGTGSADEAAVLVENSANVVVDDTETTQSLISGIEYAGMEVKSGTATLKGQAKISGRDGVLVSGGSFMMQDSARVDGIGKYKEGAPSPVGAAIEVVSGGHAYIADGSLYSEYGYAIYTGGNKPDPDLCFVANDQEVIKTSWYNCKDPAQYNSGIIIVNDQACANVTDAQSKINAAVADGNDVVVKLLGDVSDNKGFAVSKGNVSFVGNGHTLKVSSRNGLSITGGNVNITGLAIEADNSYSCIAVTGGNVNIGEGTIAKTGVNGLYADNACSVSVNGFTTYCTNGFQVKNDKSKVVVNSCKDNAANPVGSGSQLDGLKILGGFFLSKGTAPNNVEKFIVPGVSYISTTTNSDGYYVVSMEQTPTVEIVNGTTGYNAKGLPYVVYDKANPKYITFKVDPKVLRIDAVPVNGGTSINVFNNTTNGGTEGEIVIDIDAFQMNLKSGVYDLQFKFKNGYVMSQKLNLEVLPELTKLVARSNFADASPASVRAKDIATAVNAYQVGAKQYIYAEVTELPERIGVSADPNGNETTWFDYYNPAVDGVRVLQKDNGHYYILVDYAFLDQLAAGQDYIFLDYNGAMKRLDLKITNPNVSVEPTYLNYWGKDGSAEFTVKPDFKDVYIDGELVPTQFVKYNNDTKKLNISGEYLNQLNKGDHLVEIETSKGWLSATVHTGVALRPIDVDYHVYGGAKALAFQASDVIDTSAGIWIGKNNPVQIPADMIYFYDNNTKFTVSPSYLNRLALGTYYISAYVWNGEDYEYTSTTFRIVSASSAAYNPNTGDTFNPVVWIVIAVLAAVIVVVFLVPALKKKGGADVAKAAEEEIKEAKKKD